MTLDESHKPLGIAVIGVGQPGFEPGYDFILQVILGKLLNFYRLPFSHL